MSDVNRRSFLQQLGSAAVLPAAAGLASSVGAQGQAGSSSAGALYDLLIQGGRLIDPASRLSAVRDVAIAGGRIARVAEDIPPAQARQVYSAAGKLVTPGLIDMHTHVYRHAINLS